MRIIRPTQINLIVRYGCCNKVGWRRGQGIRISPRRGGRIGFRGIAVHVICDYPVFIRCIGRQSAIAVNGDIRADQVDFDTVAEDSEPIFIVRIIRPAQVDRIFIHRSCDERSW